MRRGSVETDHEEVTMYVRYAVPQNLSGIAANALLVAAVLVLMSL